MPATRKVKTGCKTCKLRRVKCDESKPECQRCVSAGRFCAGYGIWGGGSKRDDASDQSTAVSTMPSTRRQKKQHRLSTPVPGHNQTPAISADERICLDYFVSCVSPRLSAVFDSQFWLRFVPQACASEPLVLHASLALGAVYKSKYDDSRSMVLCQDRRLSVNNNPHYLALSQYNKALNLFRAHVLKKDPSSQRVTLTVSALLIAFEIVLGNYEAAMIHINHSFSIINNLTLLPSEEVTEPFSQMLIQLALIGGMSVSSYLPISKVARQATCINLDSTREFSNLFEAHQTINTIIMNAIQLSEWCRSSLQASNTLSDDLLARHQRLEKATRDWFMAYTASKPKLISKSNHRTMYGVYMLQIFHSLATIIIASASSSRLEAIPDQYTDTFVSIITQVITLWDMTGFAVGDSFERNRRITGPRVTMEMAIVPILFYTALKCRSPSLRRQAASLLMVSQYNDGIWHSGVAARLALTVIEMEERGAYADVEFDSDPFRKPHLMQYRALPTLPYTSRFHEVRVVLSNGSRHSGKLVCRKAPVDGRTIWAEETAEGMARVVEATSPCLL
ncbi:uncharacterized protein TRIVIDRAFT_189391 [Trichoderma virens Gv29-8]|uniref:Zn(2)-C6 fungal-type domain-containing protein n=1 Tax=Hypocrea virens (strain Gv29-8 / FGSC 10586) TaxID=413071 RepID=G9MJG4_HYPVG|nr:uncharacterized protein TRIVIDRAFT_189391 [Trichoderma virens Gv29-8]EHK25627.1 hypothetical protein TRIVIDRAFT_189391 [Trichoderma virens Gv29-8]